MANCKECQRFIEHLQTRLAFLSEMDVSLQNRLVRGNVHEIRFDEVFFSKYPWIIKS